MDASGCALAAEPGVRAEAGHAGNNSATVRLPGGLEHPDAGIRPFARDLPGTPVTWMRPAAVADDALPVRWTGRQAVVTLPEHIDDASTDQVRDQLLRIINGGAAVLIADLTGTVYCDYCGAYALARAQQRARASGTELRLVATRDVARRVFTLSWLDRPVAVYPDLDAAIAAGAEGRKPRGEEQTQVADHAARAEELLPA